MGGGYDAHQGIYCRRSFHCAGCVGHCRRPEAAQTEALSPRKFTSVAQKAQRGIFLKLKARWRYSAGLSREKAVDLPVGLRGT